MWKPVYLGNLFLLPRISGFQKLSVVEHEVRFACEG